MSVDLTKLTGPELAELMAREWKSDALVVPAGFGLIVAESARRHREDTREWQRRLEKERDGLRARVRELEDGIIAAAGHEFVAAGELAGIDDKGCYQVAGDGTRHDAEPWYVIAIAAKRIAELEAQLREANGKLAQIENIELSDLGSVDVVGMILRSKPEPDCAPIAESPFPAAVAVAHGVSTAELTPFEIAAANACGAMRVDADGLGFVNREWLERHRSSESSARAQVQAAWGAGTGTTPLSEPAERKAQEERRYGGGRPNCAYPKKTLAELMAVYEDNPSGAPIGDALIHLRETLATLKAVEAFADDLERRGYEARASQLREVLNGKR